MMLAAIATNCMDCTEHSVYKLGPATGEHPTDRPPECSVSFPRSFFMPALA